MRAFGKRHGGFECFEFMEAFRFGDALSVEFFKIT